MGRSNNHTCQLFFTSSFRKATKAFVRRRFVSAVFILPLLLLIPMRAAATTHYVCGSISACNSNGGSGWSGTPADTGACTSKTSPCLTIQYGVSQMQSGDTLVIGNGTYTNPPGCTEGTNCNTLSEGLQTASLPIPNGSAGNYTVIRADTDWGVTIDGQMTTGTGTISNWDYGIIRGIVFYRSDNPSLIFYSSNNVKAIRNAFVEQDGFGLVFSGSSYCVAEQNIAFGSGTYFFVDGNANKPSYNVYRENVVRRDAYVSSDNHYAAFGDYEAPTTPLYFFDNIDVDSEFYPAPYSNFSNVSVPQSGTITSCGSVTTAGQSCSGQLTITDSNANWASGAWGITQLYFTSGPDTGHQEGVSSYTTNTATVSAWQNAPDVGDSFIIGRAPYTQASIYTTNQSGGNSNLVVDGYLAINVDSDGFDSDGGLNQNITNAAFFLSPNPSTYLAGAYTGGGWNFTNNIVYGAAYGAPSSIVGANWPTGIGIAAGSGGGTTEDNIEYNGWRGIQYQQSPTGTVEGFNDVWNNSNADFSNYTAASSDFSTDPTTIGLLYPTMIQSGSTLATAGAGGGQVGPTMLYRIGATGSAEDCGGSNDGTMSCLAADEPGFNTLSTVPLWPWPNEAKIKALMSAYNLHGVNGQRGFCAPGNDKWGQPITLTRYIWEYLGNEIPADIYGTSVSTSSALPAPTGIHLMGN